MSKHFAVAVALVAACASASAASAWAETTLSAGVKMTPGKTGTAKRPQGVKLAIKIDLFTPTGEDRPTVTGFEVWHGPGLAFDRGGPYAECSGTVLSRGGPDACPSAARLSLGSGTADVDTIESTPKLIVFNGPGRTPLIYGTLQRPARVRGLIHPRVVDNPHSAWPHRTRWTIPPILRLVAGIPITFEPISFTYGHLERSKYYISTTSCPKGGWRWRVRVHTWYGPANAPVLQQDGRVPCQRAAA